MRRFNGLLHLSLLLGLSRAAITPGDFLFLGEEQMTVCPSGPSDFKTAVGSIHFFKDPIQNVFGYMGAENCKYWSKSFFSLNYGLPITKNPALDADVALLEKMGLELTFLRAVRCRSETQCQIPVSGLI